MFDDAEKGYHFEYARYATKKQIYSAIACVIILKVNIFRYTYTYTYICEKDQNLTEPYTFIPYKFHKSAYRLEV